MDLLAVAEGVGRTIAPVFAAASAEGEGGGGGLTINLFWIIVAAANFLLFFALAYYIVLKPVGATVAARRERIEQGLKDADAARADRESAAEQRQAIVAEARREANDIVVRAQKAADEARDQGVAETRAEIERLREQAVADIEAERQRALADVRSQVADLALQAAGRVVGETMSSDRERRLVDEFLAQVTAPAAGTAERN